MELNKPQDLFLLSAGDSATKRNLFDLIQYSKVAEFQYWGGEEMKIGNTPQQGINWIGDPPACHPVIIKARPGSYIQDGWSGEGADTFNYSFKARAGEISYSEKVNLVLINNPGYQYPMFLFTEVGASWNYEGVLFVAEIVGEHVCLKSLQAMSSHLPPLFEERLYKESGRNYLLRLVLERNQLIVSALEEKSGAIFDIFCINFKERYGVSYIEGHHKVPISTVISPYIVSFEGFALLCPNCHQAVHVYMKEEGLDYLQIKEKICGNEE